MGNRVGRPAWLAFILILNVFAIVAAIAAQAAPYAAFVMDARTGAVIHSRNAETPLHPASLTKMMTLYVAFQAIQRGEITLDTEIRIPRAAADEPPSRLGLREGQVIRMRYLLRAAAVKSANDAATAIGYAIGGSQDGFADRMNAMAEAMGMTGTRFQNMHGLTSSGHYSTARDMSVLGRHLIYDFPQYYNLFSRRTADAGIAEVSNTNRRFLDSYEGADGIKTGFTNAAGYNLTASAQRGEVRIIATVFGGTSTANRNAQVAELMDLGFSRAPRHAQVSYTPPPAHAGAAEVEAVMAGVANADRAPATAMPATAGAVALDGLAPGQSAPASGHVVRVSGQVQASLRPLPRPGAIGEAGAPADGTDAAAAVAAAVADSVDAALAEALAAPAAAPASEPEPEAAPEPQGEIIMTADAIAPEAAPLVAAEPEVVTRVSTSGGRHWGINLGRYPTRDAAERALLAAALTESAMLDTGLRRTVQRSGAFDANVMGLTREEADLACRRLQARGTTCFQIGTEG